MKPVAPATGVVTGSVTFRSGAEIIGTGNVANGVATLKTASLPIGTHGIRATFEFSTGSIASSPLGARCTSTASEVSAGREWWSVPGSSATRSHPGTT